MGDGKTATDLLVALVLSGIMGMIGQGARTIVGLKKVSDVAGDSPSQADAFQASRILIGLMIGFVAGVVAGLSLDVANAKTIAPSLLLGLAAAGYAGTDFIEGFASTLSAVPAPRWQPPRISDQPVSGMPVVTAAVVKPAGRGFGFEHEYHAAAAYLPHITQFSAAHQLAVELVYAIGSRESAWGLTLRPPGPAGTGDWAARGGRMPPDGLGWGRGLMQADYAASEFAKTGAWRDPAANIAFGCNELGANIAYFSKEGLGADAERAGIAAYNCGRGNVHKALAEGKDIDALTTGHDYSVDVLRRAEWFKARIAREAVA